MNDAVCKCVRKITWGRCPPVGTNIKPRNTGPKIRYSRLLLTNHWVALYTTDSLVASPQILGVYHETLVWMSKVHKREYLFPMKRAFWYIIALTNLNDIMLNEIRQSQKNRVLQIIEFMDKGGDGQRPRERMERCYFMGRVPGRMKLFWRWMVLGSCSPHLLSSLPTHSAITARREGTGSLRFGFHCFGAQVTAICEAPIKMHESAQLDQKT